MTSKSDPGLDNSFAAALQIVQDSPESEAAWEHLEELADNLERPEEVAALYRTTLAGAMPSEAANKIGERAVAFHEEWFGDTPDAVSNLLSEILDRDPDAAWAFDRLTVSLTADERWEELLGAYDTSLAVVENRDQLKQRLDDAAQVARDFADQPLRAADYMRRLLDFEPSNQKLEASLARMYERQQRWDELISLWRTGLKSASRTAAQTIHVRIATCLLDRISAPDRALSELETLLAENPGHAEACDQLERVLIFDGASNQIRSQAVALLRKNYDAARRPDAVVKVLSEALVFSPTEEHSALHRELGTRFAILGNDNDALDHYGALLCIDPTDTDARKQLRQLASRSNQHTRHAQLLIEAGESCEDGARQVALFLEAAHLHRDVIGDAEQAAKLYARVLDNPNDGDPSQSLSAAHSLNELLAAAERSAERLPVLEKIASLERSKAVRRSVLGEAATLAAELGDTDRALNDWGDRLQTDSGDAEALDAVIGLLDASERWSQLVASLQRRAAEARLPQQRRADLVRIAELQEQKLDQWGPAIDTWITILDEFGDSDQAFDHLDRLMSGEGRYAELAERLGSAAKGARRTCGQRLARVGTLLLENLQEPTQALLFQLQAIAIDPTNDAARAGLQALIEVQACRAQASSALAQAFETCEQWPDLLALLETRIDCAASAQAQARLLREAAGLYRQADEPINVHSCLCRALAIEPTDLALEQEIMRVSAESGRWAETSEALQIAASNTAQVPPRCAQLNLAAATILEIELDDPTAATDVYLAAADMDPSRLECHQAIARCASQAGRWKLASEATIATIQTRERIDETAIQFLADTAQSRDQLGEFAEAFSEALQAAAATMHDTLTRKVELQISDWFNRAGREQAAKDSVRRAVDLDPTHPESLDMLCELQRENPGPALVTTLLRVDTFAENNLDALHEAAEVALEHADAQIARQALLRLYRKSARMMSRSDLASGTHTPVPTAMWALEKLVHSYEQTDQRAEATRLLLDGATLPIEARDARTLRRRAAEQLVESGHLGRALDLYLGIIAEAVDDTTLITRAAALCQQEDRISELLSLRRRELELSDDLDRELELRLEISRLTGLLESRGGRLESLLANLRARAGHGASIDALTTILEERGRYPQLLEILEDQAALVASDGDSDRAATLWFSAGDLAKDHLTDHTRAIANYSHVVALRADNQALEFLAQLHLAHGNPAEAARWLRVRIETCGAGERISILLQLARANLQAKETDAAIETLESAFSEAPRNGEVRKLLLTTHRQRHNWAALARVLSTAAQSIRDDATVLAYAREATSIYNLQLQQPELAVPVLQKALRIASDDRGLRSLLAEGLRTAGKLDEAQSQLGELIESFGRRRSPERANAHLQLGRVLSAQGDRVAAIVELQTAAKMDNGNLVVLKALAELARDAGEPDKAERAYRTLLVQLRRASAQDLSEAQTGPVATLLELAAISRERGQQDRAEELVESALEALVESDEEAEQVQARLRDRAEYDVLRRVLDTRLQHVASTRQDRGRIHAAMADLLEHNLDRKEEAMQARLQALTEDPGAPELHDAAATLAEQLDDSDRYRTQLETLLESTRRSSDATMRCELLLRLGAILERCPETLDQACDLYEQAQETGIRHVDVWRALAHVAGARGQHDRQLEILTQLAELGAEDSDTRIDALYRLAEVQIATLEHVAEGVEALRSALDNATNYARAEILLRAGAQRHPDHEGLFELFESVARRSGADRFLLHFIECSVARPNASPALAREGVEIIKRLAAVVEQETEEPLVDPDTSNANENENRPSSEEQAEALMQRAIELGGDALDGMSEVSWAMLGLAERRRLQGNLADAAQWLCKAAQYAPLETVLSATESIVEQSTQANEELTRVTAIYERLLERDATRRDVWQPLAKIYLTLGNVAALERMVDETLDSLRHGEDRNALRIEFARALLVEPDRASDAVDLLREALLEIPEDAQAQQLLAQYLETTGDLSAVLDLLRKRLMSVQLQNDPQAIKQASLDLIGRLRSQDNDQTEAPSVCRGALDLLPEDADLLRTLLDLDNNPIEEDERFELMRRLLAVETEDAAPALTALLLERCERAGDPDAAMKILTLGYSRSPKNQDLRARLTASYVEQDDFSNLVKVLVEAAEGCEKVEDTIELLVEAARLQRDALHSPGASAKLLRRCWSLQPEKVDHCIELSAALSSALQHSEALEVLTLALESHDATKPSPLSDRQMLALLRARATIHDDCGDDAAALSDLKAAAKIDLSAVAGALEVNLKDQYNAAKRNGDIEEQHARCMDLVKLAIDTDRESEAQKLLHGWIEQCADDLPAWVQLRDVCIQLEDWEQLATCCDRLITLGDEDLASEAAIVLAETCTRLGRPEDARAGLELAFENQPDQPDLRRALRNIYETIGATSPLAAMLLEDAREIIEIETRLPLLRKVSVLLSHGDDNALAIETLLEILDADPEDKLSRALLVDTYVVTDALDLADEVLDEVIASYKVARSPELSSFHHRKARVAQARDDRPAQLQHLKSAFSTDKHNGAAAAELAELAEDLEDWELATRVLRGITAISGPCPISRPAAFLRQGKISLRLGDVKRASFWARRARQEDPEFVEAQSFLDEVSAM